MVDTLDRRRIPAGVEMKRVPVGHVVRGQVAAPKFFADMQSLKFRRLN